MKYRAKPRASAIIIYRNNNGSHELLFQHRSRYFRHGGNKLGFIQGTIDMNESAVIAAYREGIEEANLQNLCDFYTFKKYAVRITKGEYNVFLLNTSKIPVLKQRIKKWFPHPLKKFRNEMSYSVYNGGHVYIPIHMVYKLINRNDLLVDGLDIWIRTKIFLKKYWNTILKLL